MNVLDSERATLEMPENSHSFIAGSLIGNYKISSLLSTGSQSTVFEVTNACDGTAFVMRVYFDSEKPDEELVRKLFRNAENMLYPVLDRGIHCGHYYEIIPKLNCIPDIRTMNADRQDNLLAQEANAIKAFHSLGYLHLDIKKEHFMVKQNGSVVLIDIGSAVKIGTEGIRTLSQFSAPEAYGGAYSEKSDLFSFGIAVLEQFIPEMFSGKTRQEIIAFVCDSEKLEESVMQIPERLRNEVRSLLCDNPLARTENKWFGVSRDNIPLRRLTDNADVQELREKVASSIMKIATTSLPGAIESVKRAASDLHTDDYISMVAFCRFLDTVHTDESLNYTNISVANALQAIKTDIVTSTEKLSKSNPVLSLKRMSKKGVYYVFSQTVINELDSASATRNNLKNKRAWAILRGIGYAVGAVAAVIAAIALIAIVLYALYCLIQILIIGALLCSLLAGLLGG